jgi:ribosomal-protein-alanine N-acetyltransferase
MPSSPTEGFVLQAMTKETARTIAGWQYTGEYALFNVSPDELEGAVRDYLDPEFDYHSVWHPSFELAGFCCYGTEAQVPGGEYGEEAIDVGLSLRPDLVGCGLGGSVLKAVLAERAGDALPLRATVAVFNGRSRRLFEKAGFTREQFFQADRPTPDGKPIEFSVLVRRTPIW